VRTEVLVVGAGPVGLMLAAELQRRRVDHLLVEQTSQPTRFVKALGITPRTLEIWEQVGILQEALDAGTFLRGNCTLVNGVETDRQEIPRGRFPIGFLTLAQYEAERILRDHLLRIGGEITWGTALTGIEEAGASADRLVAHIRLASGDEAAVECRYVVGCDGAHSAVRHALGLEFEGDAVPMVFLLGDVAVTWDLPRGFVYRMLHVVDDQMRNQGVAVPIPGDTRRYRLSMAAPDEFWAEGADLSAPPSLDLIASTIAPMMPAGARVGDVRWSSLYRISHRIVPRYSRGRAFLAGDAAHIHPPIGGQGMNTGLQDAFNLGWKLALAVAGRATPDLLESYDAERRPVGLDVVTRTSRRMEQAIEGEDRGESADQLEIDSQLGVNYRGSRWVAEDVSDAEDRGPDGGPRPGDRAPDVDGLRRDRAERPLRLAELLRHAGHTLLLYADGTTSPAEHGALAEIADSVPRDLVRVYGIAAASTSSGPSAAHERFPWIEDGAGRFRDAYGAAGGALYLVRPDGHLAYRARHANRPRLAASLARVLASRE
jgi:2-polyprenyl-6-methoxyphenol hydroxylase-like FAD-dependent oxidoreductase